MPRKTRQDALLTRERILDAAVDVFHERGVARPSLTDVAARIGMTRGAVYGHFRNKGDVLVALFERERLPWEEFVAAGHAAGGDDPLEVLRHALASLLRRACDSPVRARTLNILFYKVELAVEHPALVERLNAARQESHARLMLMIKRARKAGRLPGTPGPKHAARLLQQAAFGVLLDWLWDPSGFDLAREADRVADALLATIGAPPAAGRTTQTG